MEPRRPEDLPQLKATNLNHVTVTKVDRKKTPQIIIDMTQEQRCKEDFHKLYYTIRQLKTEGIRKFYAGFYEGALKCYKTAKEICEAIYPDSDDRKQVVYQVHQEVCNQAALTCFKIRKYQNAIRYSQSGTEIPGKDDLKAKSHFWWAKALLALGKLEEGRVHLLEAKRLDKNYHNVGVILEEVNREINGRGRGRKTEGQGRELSLN